MTSRIILWLCPVQSIDPEQRLTPQVTTIAKHSNHGVARWLDAADAPDLDAVVVDVSVAQGHNYDPGVIAELLVDRCVRPPRHIIAVVKRGNDDPITSQYAFAHEIHLMWKRLPQLVVEESVLYYVERASTQPTATLTTGDDKGKQNRIGQTRRWGEIASRAASFVTDELTPEPSEHPREAFALVQSICDLKRGALHFRMSPAERSVLISLADSEPDVHRLVDATGYTASAVRSALRAVSAGLNTDAGGLVHTGRQERAMGFCAGLARRYGPWLRSVARRS